MAHALAVAEAMAAIGIEVVKILSPVATAVIAFLALKNWKRQEKAKRQSEFLDELIDATHSYITSIARPITVVEFVRIAMKSHSGKWEDEDEAAAINDGAVTYIRNRGEEDAKRLIDSLEDARVSKVRLRSLSAKGQIFRFKGYKACERAIAMLVWQLDRIEAFASMISFPTLNWDNLEVQRSLHSTLKVQPEDIRTQLAESNVAIHDFVQATYKDLYG